MPCHRKRDFFNILYAVLNQSIKSLNYNGSYSYSYSKSRNDNVIKDNVNFAFG